MAKGGTIEYGIRFNVDQSSLSTIRTEINRISHEIKEMSKDPETLVSKDTIANVEKLQHALNQSWNNKLNQLNLTKFQSELQKSKISMSQLKNTFLEIGKFGTFNNLTSNLLTANAQLKVTNDWMERIATSFGNVARYALSSKIFNNFVNSISQAYKFTVDLDTALNRIRIVSNQSAEQMDRFAVNANKAAKALGTSTLEYAKGALIYYQQGLSAEEANKRTEVTLKMANVLGASAQEVSNYMTAIWNNFDHGTETLEHYADVITALGAATASSSEEIATGLEKFAAVANTIGLSYEYATTALATVVAQTRQSADTVGTAFRTIFARMEDLKLGKTLDDGTTLGKYSSTLEKIGVSIKDQNGQLKDMDTILSEMGAKWQTLSKDQQVAVAQGVAGIRQYTQLTALMDNWDKFTQNLTVAQGATGTLQRQQDTYMESFEAHLQKLSTEAERTYSILFDADSAKDFIDVLVAGFTKINDVLENMGGGLNTFINLLSQVGTIFSKQIGTEVVRVWNNAKTSFMGQKKKEAFVDDVIQAYQEPNKTGLEKIYGKNDLTDKAVEQQAKNIKEILNVSSGLTSETQEQVVKEQQKIAILDVEIEKREKVLNLAKEHNILTSKQAEEWQDKAAKQGLAGAVHKYGEIGQALKEKETGIDQQQRQERIELNQNRTDIIQEGKQNQDITKTTRKVFAAVQGVNALTSAIKVLSDQSATTQQKVDGVVQSTISGIGAAVSTFNPLIGMLIQIGGPLLAPLITGLFDFRSEAEKLQDTIKETQKTFEEASNKYQELKGTLSNYESAKKGLEGLEQGTLEFYDAILKANEEAQKLIEQLHLIAGQDYSINLNTGAIEFNQKSIENAMFEQQQKVARAQVANLQAQYDFQTYQRKTIVDSASKATTTKDGYRISSQTMEDILTRAIEKVELGAEDRSGKIYKTSSGDVEKDIINPLVEGNKDLTEQTKDITTIVSDYRAEYNKVSAEMLALQKQIAQATIQAYGTKAQIDAYQKATTTQKGILTSNVADVDQSVLNERKENTEDFYTYWSLRTTDQTKSNREVAKKLGFTDEDLNQIEGFEENRRANDAFKTEESYWKSLYAYKQGYRYDEENETWRRKNGTIVADADEEIYNDELDQIAQDYLINEIPRISQMGATFDQLKNINASVDQYFASSNQNQVSDESKRYVSEAMFAAKNNADYNYQALSKEEAIATKDLLMSDSSFSLSPIKNLTGGLSVEDFTELNKAIEGNQDVLARTQKDLTEYNDAMDQNATALGTSSEALKLYDAALQNSEKHTVDYNRTLADTAADNYKFNKSFNQGRKAFSDNKKAWESYTKSLKSGKAISYDVADGAGEIVKSLKDMNLSLKTEDLKNPTALKNIEKLLSGTEKEAEAAYKELEKLSIVNTLTDNFSSQFEQAGLSIQEFADYLGGLDPGAKIDKNWSKHLVDMVNNSNMTLDEVKQLFANANIQMPPPSDYKISEKEVKSAPSKTKHTYEGKIPTGKTIGGEAEYIPVHYSWEETIEPLTQPYFEFTGQNVTLQKGSSSAKNFTTSPSSKSGGGKKGGGGSSSKAKKIDPLDEEADRYHKINTQIAKVENQLKKVQSQQQKLVGAKLIENLNKQWNLLNTQVQNYNEKIRIAKGEQGELAKTLAKQGVIFNADGTIANYMEAFQAQENYVNGLINQYNRLSKKQQETWDNNKTIDKAKENFNKFKENMDRYDTLVANEIPGLEQSILDSIDKQIELNIQKFNLELTVTLNMNQATRDWNAWKKKVIDGIKDDDILGNSRARLGDFSTYFRSNGAGDIQAYTRQVNNILKELKEMDETGSSTVYGDNRQKALDELNEKYTALMESMTSELELEEELYQNILDEMDKVQEKFDQQIESYQFLRDILNHDIKVIQMVYGEDSYGDLAKFYERQQKNYENQLDFQRQQKEFWYAEMQAAEKGSEEWEKAKENWVKAVNEFNNILEEGLENAKNKFQNAINDIFKNLNNTVTGGMGLDYVNEQWNLINQNADRYLDTINKSYGIRALERKYTDAINKSTNINAQQKLKKIMDDQLEDLKQRDRLTQYDLDRANKLYDIELARLALEEAQMNKSQMRLRRDSQGNYTYQYVANDNKIAEAEAKIEDLYNQLYNFDKERYNAVLNDAYNAWNEYQQKMAEAAMINDPQQRAEREMLIQEEYDQLLTQIEQDYQISRYTLQQSFFAGLELLTEESLNNINTSYGTALVNADGTTTVTFDNITNTVSTAFGKIEGLSDDTFEKLQGHFDELSDKERYIVMKSLIPTWENGISQMVQYFIGGASGNGGVQAVSTNFKNAVSSMQELFTGKDGKGGFVNATKDGWDKIKTAEHTYQVDLNTLETVAGQTFDKIKNGEDEAYQKAQPLINKNNEIITTYEKELKAVKDVYDQVIKLKGAFDQQYESAKKAADEAYRYNQQELERQRKEAENLNITKPDTEQNNNPPKQEEPTNNNPPVDNTPKSGTGDGKASVGDEVTVKSSAKKWGSKSNSVAMWYKVPGNKFYIKAISGNQAQIGDPHGPNYTDRGITGWANISDLTGYDTGGYTGSWGSSGRLAMLHQKELVLNAQDTENMLNTVAIMRGLAYSLGSNMLSRLAGATATGYSGSGSDNGILEQNVHIDATFPNVKNATEIEEALNNLVNAASQRAYKRR